MMHPDAFQPVGLSHPEFFQKALEGESITLENQEREQALQDMGDEVRDILTAVIAQQMKDEERQSLKTLRDLFVELSHLHQSIQDPQKKEAVVRLLNQLTRDPKLQEQLVVAAGLHLKNSPQMEKDNTDAYLQEVFSLSFLGQQNKENWQSLVLDKTLSPWLETLSAKLFGTRVKLLPPAQKLGLALALRLGLDEAPPSLNAPGGLYERMKNSSPETQVALAAAAATLAPQKEVQPESHVNPLEKVRRQLFARVRNIQIFQFYADKPIKQADFLGLYTEKLDQDQGELYDLWASSSDVIYYLERIIPSGDESPSELDEAAIHQVRVLALQDITRNFSPKNTQEKVLKNVFQLALDRLMSRITEQSLKDMKLYGAPAQAGAKEGVSAQLLAQTPPQPDGRVAVEKTNVVQASFVDMQPGSRLLITNEVDILKPNTVILLLPQLSLSAFQLVVECDAQTEEIQIVGNPADVLRLPSAKLQVEGKKFLSLSLDLPDQHTQITLHAQATGLGLKQESKK